MNITFVGDIFPADESYYVGFGLKSQFRRTKGIDWHGTLCSITKDSDLVIGNIESPLLPEELTIKDNFYGDIEFAPFLKKCGFGVLNVANNHILEHGVTGYNQTIKALDEAGIGIIGNKKKILYINKEDCKIAIAGFCGIDTKAYSDTSSYSLLSMENVNEALQQMSEANADLKVFCFHWGNEYINKPSTSQQKLARYLIDNGADVIIGHHPHVIQPYETYKHGHIFYSLGNFCFDNPYQSHHFSIGMGVTLTFDASTKKIRKVELFGLKLLLAGLVKKMSTMDFQSYFNEIQHKYDGVRDSLYYSLIYSKELKRRHFRERLLMKFSLVVLLAKLNHKERIRLLQNITRFVFKRINLYR